MPRHAWQVIDAARHQFLTGELTLPTTPPSHVYLRDGQVYFAERSTDGGLGVRLLVEGVITRAQLHKGALLVSGTEHLGRLFERDDTVERGPVELCVELMTDDVLVQIANDVVTDYRLTLYRRHPSGIDRWLPRTVEVVSRLVERPEHADPDDILHPATPSPPRRALVPVPVVPPAFNPVPPVDLVPAAVPVVPAEPAPLAPAPMVDSTTIDDDSGFSLAHSAVEAIMSTAIAEEVAEAVRRALATIDMVSTPPVAFSPSDLLVAGIDPHSMASGGR